MIGQDPIRLFESWFKKAQRARIPLPESMTLATVDARGRPSARMVLLKGVHQGDFLFFTNYGSRKSRELATRPRAALVFHWATLELQVRIEGSVTKTSRAESEAYFKTRPRDSQLGAWASQQSSPLSSRAELVQSLKNVKSRFPGETAIPCPPFWGGYRVRPTRIEFWHGRPARLHDRVVFEKTSARGRWKTQRLFP